jgi:hypothetical protein
MEKVCYRDLRFPGILLVTDVSEQSFVPILNGQADKENNPRRWDPKGFPETSVINYQSALRNTQEGRRFN